jgi:hypothetical protein
MRAFIIAAIVALALVAPAWAVTATLVSSQLSTSVSGLPIWVCVYRYGDSTFERILPNSAGPCPFFVEVQ